MWRGETKSAEGMPDRPIAKVGAPVGGEREAPGPGPGRARERRFTRTLPGSFSLLTALVILAGGCVDDPAGPATGHAVDLAPGFGTGTTYSLTIVEDLSTSLETVNGMAQAINEARQITGWRATPPTTSIAYIWSKAGGLTDLGTLGKVPYTSQGYDINDAGVVVGQASGQAFAWSAPGPMKQLGGGPNSTGEIARGIANSGRIVGGMHYPNWWYPVYWPSVASNPATFPLSAPYKGYDALAGQAFGVNEHGAVVGYWNDVEAFHWSHGSGFTDLAQVPGGVRAAAYAINDDGVIVGYAKTATGFNAIRWPSHQSSPQMLGTLGGNWSKAFDINAGGTIVGAAADKAGTSLAFRLEPNGFMEPLQLPFGAASSEARGINDRGDIVGGATYPNGEVHPVVWWRYEWKVIWEIPVQWPKRMSPDDPGVVTFALLSTDRYGAYEMDPATITAGDGRGFDVGVLRDRAGEYATLVEDVDRNGVGDLIVQFDGALLLEQEIRTGAGSAELVLKGATRDRANAFQSTGVLRIER